MLNIEDFNNIDITTEDRSCQDCIYSNMCECDMADMQVCRNYVDSNLDILQESLWQEMSYNRYTETALDCRSEEDQI